MDRRNEISTDLVSLDYSSMSTEMLNLIQEKVILAKMKIYEQQLSKLKNDMERVAEIAEQKTEEALGHLKDATEIFTSKTKMRIAPNGYGNLTELGELFDGKIGARQVGNLLRMAGLAMAKESSTVPYQNTPVKYCRQYVYTDYYGREHYGYVWNFVECKNAIEIWLNKNDLLVGFLKCSSKAKVSEYISNIYKKYKMGEYDA